MLGLLFFLFLFLFTWLLFVVFKFVGGWAIYCLVSIICFPFNVVIEFIEAVREDFVIVMTLLALYSLVSLFRFIQKIKSDDIKYADLYRHHNPGLERPTPASLPCRFWSWIGECLLSLFLPWCTFANSCICFITSCIALVVSRFWLCVNHIISFFWGQVDATIFWFLSRVAALLEQAAYNVDQQLMKYTPPSNVFLQSPCHDPYQPVHFCNLPSPPPPPLPSYNYYNF